MQIILASQSPYRRALLENFGLKFESVAPLVNEDELKETGPEDLLELTRFLSLQKANSLRTRFPNAIILGSDQLAELAGRRLDKPGSVQRAIDQLKQLQGRAHRLITSLAVVSPSQTLISTNVTTIKLRALNDDLIHAYVKQDHPVDCAGSYKIEKAGMALIEKIESEDPSAIQGLPLTHLTKALASLNVPMSDIWEKK